MFFSNTFSQQAFSGDAWGAGTVLGAAGPTLRGIVQSSSVLASVKVLRASLQKAEGRMHSGKLKLGKVDSCLIIPYGHLSDQMHLSVLLIEEKHYVYL